MERPASANCPGVAARIKLATPSIVSWPVWSATLLSAMFARAAICGSHGALVHRRPGTKTSCVFAGISHLPKQASKASNRHTPCTVMDDATSIERSVDGI
jgi:hypothetical protein